MARYDIRQDMQYRRGLILGLTIAEVMILLIFVLLMSLASALSNRDRKLEAVSDNVGSRLIAALQEAYPDVASPNDYYKELVRAIEARKAIDKLVPTGIERDAFIENAGLGKKLREAAAAMGAENPVEFAATAMDKAKLGKKGEWPPFFNLSEAGGYFFESGKATLRPDFVMKLDIQIIPLLKRYVEEYGVDVVEVIGHTDEVPMAGESNLDDLLIPVSEMKTPIEALQSSDNAGLAMARAVAVVRILRADPRLEGIVILPLSGAQLIVPVDKAADGSSTLSDQSRRRIEMRLRRSTSQVERNG